MGIWKGGQIPYFNFAEDEIAHFEYRMCPYTEWITFEDIPLKPGEGTKMKVTLKRVKIDKGN